MPINYPDGLACKLAPTEPYPVMEAEKLPRPPALTAADRELLTLRRSLLAIPATSSFRVQGVQPPRAIFRFSDRYKDAPKPAFHKTAELTMKRNVHFPEELQPQKSSVERKRAAAAAAAAAAAEAESAGDSGSQKRLKKNVGSRLDEMAKNEDGGAGRSQAAADGDDDDDDDQEEETKAGEKNGDDDDDPHDESDEDEDLYDDQDYGGFEGYEDGRDDDFGDDGGDDEPTY